MQNDIVAFRSSVEAFLAGRISEDEFRPLRLRHGIYGQRQPGMQMVRCRIPGGVLTAAQMQTLSTVAAEFSGRAHITTRQNLQFHFVPLARVPDVMERLAAAGLTTREACFNTVRNVTACPMAGLNRDEVFDVRPYARMLTDAFVGKPLTANLPRKFKIALDGCAGDGCIAAAINDVGLRAVVRDGRRGFRMTIAGGLGALPVEARLLDEFVPAEHVVRKCAAVIKVFDQYGNRANRNLARLKFVVRERGFEWVKEQVEREFAALDIPDNAVPVTARPRGEAVKVRVHQGNLTAAQMRGLARIAAELGDGELRVGIDQNVVLAIPADNQIAAYAALSDLSLGDPGAGEIGDIVSCPGAYSCNLGLTKAMELASALRESVESYADPEVRKLSIRVSGCPNSCGHHWIAGLGFYGNARKIEGRELPYYQMVLGGGYDGEGVMRFGMAVQSIPARRAPEATRRVLDEFIRERVDGESFREYVLRRKVEHFRGLLADLTKPHPDLYADWGDTGAFSVQLGRGECGV